MSTKNAEMFINPSANKKCRYIILDDLNNMQKSNNAYIEDYSNSNNVMQR
ncbi:hypothetical protein PFDG_05229 [Plasmodium falciparum Dd2]|uniref:Uncharacterized protein n=1 Tax=Plasmodium falciparum (isolate Dd2) TaxID=57267 RepID=A0A0L7M9Z2_PLAF4|nr:hypothetical protein PFDG_05229 [Plasmodium falciparum Dd2]